MNLLKKALSMLVLSCFMTVTCFADETVRVTATGKAPLSLGVAKARSMAMVVAQQAAIEEATGVLVTKLNESDQYRVKVKSQGKVLSYTILEEESAKELYVVTIQADVLFKGINTPVRQQQHEPLGAEGYQSYAEENEHGSINWESGIIKVLGDGLDSGGNRAKARRAALADAYANAFEFIKLINVNETAKVAELVSNKEIYNALQTSIRGARIVAEGFNEQRNKFEVTLEIPIWGVSGINKAFMKVEKKASKPMPKPTPKPVMEVAAVTEKEETEVTDEDTTANAEETTAPPADREEDYTGVIVDTQDFDAEPAIFPSFVSQSGESLYSAETADEDQVEEKGMASYVVQREHEEGNSQGYLDWFKRDYSSPQFASLQIPNFRRNISILSLSQFAETGQAKPRLPRRSGRNPLIIKAVSSEGENKSTLIISNEDAEKIKKSEAIQKQLAACNVVIVLKSEAGGTEGRILFREELYAQGQINALKQ